MSGERLHVRQRLGVAGADHLAHRLRACVRLAAGRLRLRQLGRDVAELLLVEAGIAGAALENVGLRAEVLDRLFGLGHLLHQLVDLRLQRLLHVVGRAERARRQQRPIGLGEAVSDRRGELRVVGGKADADDAAILGRVDLETLIERLEDAILLALLVDVAEVEWPSARDPACSADCSALLNSGLEASFSSAMICSARSGDSSDRRCVLMASLSRREATDSDERSLSSLGTTTWICASDV